MNLLRIGVSLALVGLLAWRLNWNAMASVLVGVRLGWCMAALALTLAIQALCVRRWQLFVTEFGLESAYRPLLRYAFIGAWFNLVLPTSVGGDVLRVWYLAKNSGRRLAALATVFLDRLSGLLVLVCVGGVAALFSPQPLSLATHAIIWGSLAGAVLGLASLPLLQRWPRFADRFASQLRTLKRVCRSPGLIVRTTLLAMVIQIANVVQVYLLGQALGLSIPPVFYGVLVPLVSLLAFLPISINGIGVREGSLVFLLAPLGIEAASALSLSLLWFSMSVATGTLGGAVYLAGGRQHEPPATLDAPPLEGDQQRRAA